MMHAIIIRALFVVLSSLVGYLVADMYLDLPYSLTGSMAGITLAILFIAIEKSAGTLSPGTMAGAVAGLTLGLVLAFLVDRGLVQVFPAFMEEARPPVLAAILLGLGYLGVSLGATKGSEIRLPLSTKARMPLDSSPGRGKILDTSVIIDGRFADICDTGFIDGVLVIPRFVLDELQGIADSSDTLKRSRGRHGLDTLRRMQKGPGISIEIIDMDFPKLKGVDAKLVALAKQRGAAVVTNDYNLNKVAELQGVQVLNVNDLANALKPLLLPGETMVVKAIKEGKETGQAVAYLDDGTMVIIDSGLRFLGQNVEVTVTSVLQTTAGRMIFSKIREEAEPR